MVDIDKKEIAEKRRRLENCKAFLKGEFIGIDRIIDEVISYLSVWYLMPELLTRPIIINLWGMTGVGKTDLVRKLVKFLDFQDRFAEIELSSGWQHGYASTVHAVFDGYDLNDGRPAIALFDEIQRFSTLNSDGTPKNQSRFLDFWQLLSDGKLSRKSKDDLDSFLLEHLARKKRKDAARRNGDTETANAEEPTIEAWEAIQLRNNLSLNWSLEQLTELKQSDVYAYVQKAKKDKVIYEPVDHSRTLIFISGNLDEAYSMATNTSEADVDADIFHAFTEKITLVDIKNALSRKFRPEQVARFGNLHLIYNSLTRANFEALIQQEIGKKTGRIEREFGIEVSVSPSVEALIYRNGVFPVQGVRPVFSSVVDILDSNWNTSLLEAVVEGHCSMAIDYDRERLELSIVTGEQRAIIPYVGRVDEVRQSGEADIVANISVHECGHAVVYMLLTGMVPLQLKSKVASSYAGGFTFPHRIHATKGSELDRIRVYLAGGLAEELIFGVERASTGRSHDRRQATTIAVEYIRKYGFDEDFQAVYNLEADHLRLNTDPTDRRIEGLMAQLAAETRDLLSANETLLRELSVALSRAGSLEAKEILDLTRPYFPGVTVEAEGHMHIDDYHRRLMADARTFADDHAVQSAHTPLGGSRSAT